jgi:hypothetical protein
MPLEPQPDDAAVGYGVRSRTTNSTTAPSRRPATGGSGLLRDTECSNRVPVNTVIANRSGAGLQLSGVHRR